MNTELKKTVKILSQENKQEYVDRLKTFLPNFPDEVLISWFYDGGGIPGLYENLEFSQLTFIK